MTKLHKYIYIYIYKYIYIYSDSKLVWRCRKLDPLHHGCCNGWQHPVLFFVGHSMHYHSLDSQNSVAPPNISKNFPQQNAWRSWFIFCCKWKKIGVFPIKKNVSCHPVGDDCTLGRGASQLICQVDKQKNPAKKKSSKGERRGIKRPDAGWLESSGSLFFMQFPIYSGFRSISLYRWTFPSYLKVDG